MYNNYSPLLWLPSQIIMNAINVFPISSNVRYAIQSNNNAVDRLMTYTSKTYTPKLLNHVTFGWRNAISCLMHELRDMENAQMPLHRHQAISHSPSVAEIQPLTQCVSTVLHCSSKHAMNAHDDARDPLHHLMAGFVFAKVFKIRNIMTPHQVEIAAACVMFNAALTNHVAGLQLISSPIQDDGFTKSEGRLQSLLEAAHLYRLVLKILEQGINDGTARTLSVVALNNYAAVLTAMGPTYADVARDLYHSLFHRLSEIDEAQSNSLLLDVCDMNNIYKACLSTVFQISYTVTAPAA
jgi:hypothetical protein